jgi:protein-L-isoaspartate(D-aspartate) O-methyltransferase
MKPGASPAALLRAPAALIAAAIALVAVVSVSGSGVEEPQQIRQRRIDMVNRQIAARGIRDQKVLEVMREVPRHLFVPEAIRDRAYDDSPLPIDEGQTISQPYIVALMTELLEIQPHHRVMEIGTGSGYQAAVLSGLAAQVYTIEIKEPLYRKATAILEELQLSNIHTRHGDGYYGWEEQAPFDGIMITAAVDHVPPPLLRQLVDGGKLVLPLGHPFSFQNLVVVTKRGEDYRLRQVTGVLFVPMTGKALETYR